MRKSIAGLPPRSRRAINQTKREQLESAHRKSVNLGLAYPPAYWNAYTFEPVIPQPVHVEDGSSDAKVLVTAAFAEELEIARRVLGHSKKEAAAAIRINEKTFYNARVVGSRVDRLTVTAIEQYVRGARQKNPKAFKPQK